MMGRHNRRRQRIPIQHIYEGVENLSPRPMTDESNRGRIFNDFLLLVPFRMEFRIYVADVWTLNKLKYFPVVIFL